MAKYWHQDDLVPSGMLPVGLVSIRKTIGKPVLLVPDKVAAVKANRNSIPQASCPCTPKDAGC